MPTADVYQGSRLVGHLARTSMGSRLSFLDGVTLEHGWLATTLPPQTVESPALPAFFLNLLPEGARLKLLLESSRSMDDPLELLLRVGWDTIGDVCVVAHGTTESHSPMVQAKNLAEVSFWDLFYSGVAENPDSAVPGVQEKISASMIAFGVRAANVPSAILKLNPPKYPRLVQNEEFFLRMAKDCRIEVNRARIVSDLNREFGLLVTRFDRVKEGKVVRKLHQEDACQLLDSLPANKYHLSLREVAEKVAQVCTSEVIEVERLMRLIAFSYIIGNSDLHGKNISVLWNDVVRLSPAYDLLSTLPYPSLDRHMALKLEGKDDNFRVGDFIEFGRAYGVTERATRGMLAAVCDRAEGWIGRVSEIGFDENVTTNVQREIANRIQRLRR